MRGCKNTVRFGKLTISNIDNIIKLEISIFDIMAADSKSKNKSKTESRKKYGDVRWPENNFRA